MLERHQQRRDVVENTRQAPEEAADHDHLERTVGHHHRHQPTPGGRSTASGQRDRQEQPVQDESGTEPRHRPTGDPPLPRSGPHPLNAQPISCTYGGALLASTHGRRNDHQDPPRDHGAQQRHAEPGAAGLGSVDPATPQRRAIRARAGSRAHTTGVPVDRRRVRSGPGSQGPPGRIGGDHRGPATRWPRRPRRPPLPDRRRRDRPAGDTAADTGRRQRFDAAAPRREACRRHRPPGSRAHTGSDGRVLSWSRRGRASSSAVQPCRRSRRSKSKTDAAISSAASAASSPAWAHCMPFTSGLPVK